MDSIQVLIVVLIVLFVIGASLLTANLLRFKRMAKMYRNLTRGAQGKNLEEIICEQADKLEELFHKNELCEHRLLELEETLPKSLQKLELLKFNAFKDMGGEQSFALAVLNAQGDGLVLSNICGREDARLYAKTVHKGQVGQIISAEEQQVINEAVQKKD